MNVDTCEFRALTLEVEALREGSKQVMLLVPEFKRLAATGRRLLRMAGKDPAGAAEELQVLSERLGAFTAVLTERAVDPRMLSATAGGAYQVGLADGREGATERLRGGRHARPRGGRTAHLRLVEGGH